MVCNILWFVAAVTYNLRSYGLLIAGLLGTIQATMKAGSMTNLTVKDNGAKCVTILSEDNSFDTDGTTQQCLNTGRYNEVWSGIGVAIIGPFSVLLALWMLVFVCKSGIMNYRIDQLGFHVKWLEARRELFYKRFVLASFAYLSFVFCYGFSQIEASGALVPLLSGLLTCFIGLMDLYTPLENTIEYEDCALETKLVGYSFWRTDCHKIVELFQDAVMSGQQGDHSHMMKLVGTESEKECGFLLQSMSSIPIQEGTFFGCFGVGTDKTGGAALSPKSPKAKDIELSIPVATSPKSADAN
jgi:hypothetical protein